MKEFIRHLLIPHQSNNHRAKLLHSSSIFLLIVIFFVGGISLNSFSRLRPDVLGVGTNIQIEQLLILTNQKRLERGLYPLSLNSELVRAAEEKARDMLAKNYWAHFAPDGGTPWGFIRSAGYNYVYAGENLARGFTTSDAVVNAWMKSKTHRENMLSPNYTDIGFAIVPGKLTGDETVLVVEMLGSQKLGNNNITQTNSGQGKNTAVAAIYSEPLVNSKSLTKAIALSLLFLFIFILIVDIVIIERKKISRVISHNLDHIIYLIGIFLIILMMGKGALL